MGMVFSVFTLSRFLGDSNLYICNMEVEKKDWETKLNNLHTRQKGISSEHQINYKNLLAKVFIGETVLDVGCGTCWLADYMPKKTHYIGMDAYVNGKHYDDCKECEFCDLTDKPNDSPERYENAKDMILKKRIHCAIEEYSPIKNFPCTNAFSVDTIFVFAALDGMKNLIHALDAMKDIAKKNIVILTGVNIEPDLYHTHLITEEFIDEQMAGLTKTVRVQVHPKIVFLEYTK